MIVKLLIMVAVILLLTVPVLLRVRYDSKIYYRSRKNIAKKQENLKKRQEALNILRLHSNPSKDEIKIAHKNLMRKNHPDLGGSKFLATQINVARDILLDKAA